MLFLIVKKRNQSINQHKARAHLAWTNSPQRWMLVGGCVSYLLTLEMTSKLVGVADRATMNGYKARLELMLAHTIAHTCDTHARHMDAATHARARTSARRTHALYTNTNAQMHKRARPGARARSSFFALWVSASVRMGGCG